MRRLRAAKLSGLVLGAGLLVVTSSAATAPTPVKASSRNEATPATSGEYFAWAKSRRGRPHVFDVWAQEQGKASFKVNAPRTTGWAGGIDGRRLVFQQVRRGNSDIVTFDLATRLRRNPPSGVNTRRWEWHPSISGDWLFFGRGFAFGAGAKSVILRNLRTGEQRVLDTSKSRTAMLQAGQVSSNYAVWTRCTTRTACAVFRYDIATRSSTRMPATGQVQYAPSVTPTGTTYYGRSGPGCGANAQLVKTMLDGTTILVYSFPSTEDFSISYAALDLTVPPGPTITTRIYFDRVVCKSGRTDIYATTDAERLPP
jgi:Tol biopolymer transport system component